MRQHGHVKACSLESRSHQRQHLYKQQHDGIKDNGRHRDEQDATQSTGWAQLCVDWVLERTIGIHLLTALVKGVAGDTQDGLDQRHHDFREKDA